MGWVMGVRNASNKVPIPTLRCGFDKFVRLSRFLRSNINDSRNKSAYSQFDFDHFFQDFLNIVRAISRYSRPHISQISTLNSRQPPLDSGLWRLETGDSYLQTSSNWRPLSLAP
jgi:hypothetical protein